MAKTRHNKNNPFLFSIIVILVQTTLAASISNGFDISLASGLFSPQQKTIRQMYGSFFLPVYLEIGWNINQRLSLFSAITYESRKGKTMDLSLSNAGDNYILKFEMFSFILGVKYFLFAHKPFQPFIGGAIGYHIVNEKWLELDMHTRRQKPGITLEAGHKLRFNHHLYLFNAIRFRFLPLGKGSLLKDKINLGGWSLLIGIGHSF